MSIRQLELHQLVIDLELKSTDILRLIHEVVNKILLQFFSKSLIVSGVVYNHIRLEEQKLLFIEMRIKEQFIQSPDAFTEDTSIEWTL